MENTIVKTEIVYAVEDAISPAEFVQVLRESGLAERRPVDDDARIKKMCENANLIVTARLDGKLVGVARSLSDFSFCTYLSDLAVSLELQHQGIGKKLIDETKKASPDAMLILLAAPAAINYYPKVGMEKWEYCYVRRQ
jgi:predicted N-acetyltransferase YhbS